MKRNLLKLLVFVFSMSALMACNDNDEPNIPIEKELAGTYKGSLDITMDGVELATGLPKNIAITKAGVSSINLELKDFSFMGQNLGDIVIADCEMLKYKDRYTISGNQALTLPSIGECTVVASGTLIGGDFNVDLEIAVAVLKQTVNVSFKGAKLAGNESSEAKITSFAMDSEVITSQPIINEETGKITFKVDEAATDDELKSAPVITVSEKAIVSPASGVVQDFSNGKTVVYTVVAEDGTVKEYTVSIEGANQVLVYDFETWVPGVEGQEPEMTFYEVNGWSSSNTGAQFLKFFGFADRYVITQTEDAHSGNSAASIETIDTKGGTFIATIPKVTTGSLFLGKFLTDMENTLNSTKFGIPYSRKPLSLKGFYKYTPGETYYKCKSIETCDNATADPAAKDECAINIVIYETENYDETEWTDCLTGVVDVEKNIYTSSRIVAIGSFDSGEQRDWKEFNIELEYKKEFNPALKHRMTIACSSSKYGDKFWGAPGSVLTVDDFELIAE